MCIEVKRIIYPFLASFESRCYYNKEMKTRFIENVIEEISNELDINFKSFSDGWVLRLSNSKKESFVFGYNFELNNSVSEKIASDKIATYLILKEKGIPAIEHNYVPGQKMRTVLGYSESLEDYFSSEKKFPLVIKPISGTGGVNVLKVENNSELVIEMTSLFERYQALAVGPFYNIAFEYRVIVLFGEVLLVYKKVLPSDGWKHNLQQGAVPVIEHDQEVIKKVSEIALAAKNAIGITLAAVDIAQVDDDFMVLEINSGIMGEVFSTISPEYKQIYKNIYRKIILSIFSR